jgi:hypothetical protein
MEKTTFKVSVAISSIGRDTLFQTISSITTSPEFVNKDVQLCIFANAIADDKTLAKLLELQATYSNMNVNVGSSRLPMWESRRESVKMCAGEYVWPLGDDDLVNADAFTNLIRHFESTNPDIVPLNGEWSDYKSRSGVLPLSRAGKFCSSRPSEIFKRLNRRMDSLDLGRYVLLRSFAETWSRQPCTVDETWHEEYRALFVSIAIWCRSGNGLSIAELQPAAVILGRVKKSWDSNYVEARFGELRMLLELPEIFDPYRQILYKKERRKLLSLRHLITISLRRNKFDFIHLMPPLGLFDWVKLHIASAIPRSALQQISKIAVRWGLISPR